MNIEDISPYDKEYSVIWMYRILVIVMLNKGIRTDEYVKLSAWCAAVAAVKNICGIN